MKVTIDLTAADEEIKNKFKELQEHGNLVQYVTDIIIRHEKGLLKRSEVMDHVGELKDELVKLESRVQELENKKCGCVEYKEVKEEYKADNRQEEFELDEGADKVLDGLMEI